MTVRGETKQRLEDDGLRRILEYIRDKRGVDLSMYRQSFVFRHLRSRLLEAGCQSYLEYIAHMKSRAGEIDSLLEELSINVTQFFRDPDVFEAFSTKVLAEIVRRKESGGQRLIRVWSAACATGEEPYSIAMAMKEALGPDSPFIVRIWATDVDKDALQRAAAGTYPEKELKSVGKKFLEKYFKPSYNGTCSVTPDIQSMVRFERLNLITDEPLKSMDIIFCRNVMIYFTRQQQETLIHSFWESLNSRGYLITAKVESVWDREGFSAVDPVCKIFQKAQ